MRRQTSCIIFPGAKKAGVNSRHCVSDGLHSLQRDTYVSGIEKLERETGLEPATSSLGSWHSTTELLPLYTRSIHYLLRSK
jgi:hypothetical protein